MVVLDYKQLFGYSRRGTLWRVAAVVATIVLSFLMLVMIVVAIQKPDGFIRNEKKVSGPETGSP